MADRKRIVAGNWKMNCTRTEAESLVRAVLDKAPDNDTIKILFPPFPFLELAAQLTNSKEHFFAGAQNCSEHDKGAFTGEVSAAMLQSVGCRYVLVGHSERRSYFSESNEQLLKKMEQAFSAGLIPVFCFGELLEQRRSGKHFETVKSQLDEVPGRLDKEKAARLIFAYEPVWAIGTGETATPAQAQEMHAFIRKTLADLFGSEMAASASILYGGSCNAQNARELFACPDVDGGLIGGASLKADDFAAIIASF